MMVKNIKIYFMLYYLTVQVNTRKKKRQKCGDHLMTTKHIDITKSWLFLLIYLIHATNRLICMLCTHIKPHACIKPIYLISLKKTCRKLWRAMI